MMGYPEGDHTEHDDWQKLELAEDYHPTEPLNYTTLCNSPFQEGWLEWLVLLERLEREILTQDGQGAARRVALHCLHSGCCTQSSPHRAEGRASRLERIR